MATSSVTRMTNVSGLIDTDALVEAQMLRYKTKINTATQKKMIEEYKQEQYRTITTKAKTFYNKYFTSSGEKSLVKNSAYNVVKFDSSNSSAVTATGSSDAKAVNYSVEVTSVAKAAETSLSIEDLKSGFTLNGKQFKSDKSSNSEIVNDIKSQFEKEGITGIDFSYSDFATTTSGGFILKTESLGEKSTFDLKKSGETVSTTYQGKNCVATITDNSSGLKREINSENNNISLDGVTFNITDKTNGNVTLTGKNDASDLADKLSSFIDDYNDLMGSINTKLYETRDKSYMPLTDEDKEGLTDSQIEKLEKKAQTGLLRNDSYLTEFANSMKSSMTTIMSSSGLSLEKIGIKPVQDYTTQNGLFTVDKDKLKSALESDPDGVMELFTKGFTDTTGSVSSKGIMGKLEDNLQYHATTSNSRLAQKAGLSEGVSSISNAMTKDITERKKLIAQMQSDYTDRENKLYTKYSKLESSLSALQSQQSSLSSYFTS